MTPKTPQTLHELFDLTGKIAVVTGGSRGLGLQIAEALGEFGALTLLVARKENELREAVALLSNRGQRADMVVANLGSPDAVTRLVEQITAQHGPIDILINNAGATWGEAAVTHSIDGWNKVIGLNLTSAFLLSQAVARTSFLPRRCGSIINVASTEGLKAHHPDMTGTVAYNASKGALVNMTRALAAEWGPSNVNVNALAPGYFPSKLTAVTLERHGASLIAGTPLGRLGGEHDLKGAALLLASQAGAHITGHVLVIDGGESII